MNSDLEIGMADLKKCAEDPPPLGYYRYTLTHFLGTTLKSDLRKIMMPRMVQVVHCKKNVLHSNFHNPMQSTIFNWVPAI